MAFVEWTEEALDGLACHDAWRVGRGWEPIAHEIYEAVESYFCRQDPDHDPGFMPGKPARRRGVPADIRLALITVRSKSFRVFFRYDQQCFEIRRVYHPRAR